MHLALVALLLLVSMCVRAEARVTEVRITSDSAAFDGQSFGDVGQYRRLTGTIHGELDPADPHNAVIQDLWLAPRNARGRVEYVSDLDILVPADRAHANRALLMEVVNRGDKLAPGFFNLHVPPGVALRNKLTDPGDGYLFREGYTLVWFGWESDLRPGGGRLRLEPVVAHRPDGSPVTGLVRMEISTDQPATALPLAARAGTVPPTAPPPVRPDNQTPDADGFLPTLTVRTLSQNLRVPIPPTDWSFSPCPGADEATDGPSLCLPAGFRPGHLYELIYRARDPLVQGIGFAVARDLADFLRHAAADAAGRPNPVRLDQPVPIIAGSSQSGRFIRSFLQLGFNEAEGGGRAFDGALIHLAGGQLPLNVRFGQPHRNGGDQTDRDFPAYAFPFSYLRQSDPLTGASAGLLDRCQATNTCPRIFHVSTALEFWELRQSLSLTDPLGRADLPDLPNLRSYVLASTQHIPAPIGALPEHCRQQPNPNPQSYTLRALLFGLLRWVRDGVPPPPSVTPRIADGTLVAGDQVRFPPIPANDYGNLQRPATPPVLPQPMPSHVLFQGPRFDPQTQSGVIDLEPPRELAGDYGVRVPQVDADGNDIAGIRSVFLQVPIGTYTGWNVNGPGWFEGGLCHLRGSFIPFAATRAERLRTGDTRLSIEERYPTRAAYALAIRRAAATLNTYQFLLPEDMQALIEQADRDGIRHGP